MDWCGERGGGGGLQSANYELNGMQSVCVCGVVGWGGVRWGIDSNEAE